MLNQTHQSTNLPFKQQPIDKMRKIRDPIFKRRSQGGDEEREDKLHQKFMILEQEYDTFKQSKPRSLRRCSTDSNIIVNSLPILENSPRNLMSSLQRRSPSEEEIHRDRKAAIESSKLKGRRLFGALEGETEMGLGERKEICGVQESEVRSMSSYGSDQDENDNCGNEKQVLPGGCYSCSGSLSGERVEREKVLVEGEKVGVDVGLKRDYTSKVVEKRLPMLLMGWFSIVLLVILTLGLISMRCNGGGYGDEDEVMLVPT